MIFWILGALAYAAIGAGLAYDADKRYGKAGQPNRKAGVVLVAMVWPLFVLALLGTRLIHLIP